MKIAILIHSLGGGGAERVTVNLAWRWAEAGDEVVVLTLSDAAPRYSLHPRVRIVPLGLAAQGGGALRAMAANLRRVLKIRAALRRERPDIAIGMMTAAAVLLALARTGLPLKAIGSERVYPPAVATKSAWMWLRRVSYGLLDGIVCQTGDARDWILANTRARRAWIVPNAVRWPIVAQPPVVAPPEGRPFILAAGRFVPQKEFSRLPPLFARLAARHPDWDLAIIGEGPERAAIEAQRSALGLENRIHLPGWVGNVGQWGEAASLFVLTSRFEGFPNTLLEAMACGLPAVSVDCDTGPRDIIIDGVDGLLVPLDDEGALETALDGLMSDDHRRAAMGEQAAKVRSRFSEARIMDLWRGVIGDTVSAGCAR